MGERDLLEVLIYFIYLLGGFLILLKSAESVIDHAALVAVKRDISHHTIGMTLVALVTSLPEFAISTSSSFLGEPDIAIANVVGSNITNIALVLGLSFLLKPSDHRDGYLDALFMLTVTLVCGLLIFDGTASRVDGLILFLIIFVFIYLLKEKEGRRRKDEVDRGDLYKSGRSIRLDLLISLLGMAGIWIGGWAIIKGVVGISAHFGIAELAITLTVVALGTSLPELATALIAIRKEMGAIAVGTIIGSNVLNIAFVLGTASIVKPIVVAQSVIAYYLPLMILSALLLLIIIKRGKMGRFGGSILLLLYIAFLALVGGGF